MLVLKIVTIILLVEFKKYFQKSAKVTQLKEYQNFVSNERKASCMLSFIALSDEQCIYRHFWRASLSLHLFVKLPDIFRDQWLMISSNSVITAIVIFLASGRLRAKLFVSIHLIIKIQYDVCSLSQACTVRAPRECKSIQQGGSGRHA